MYVPPKVVYLVQVSNGNQKNCSLNSAYIGPLLGIGFPRVAQHKFLRFPHPEELLLDITVFF